MGFFEDVGRQLLDPNPRTHLRHLDVGRAWRHGTRALGRGDFGTAFGDVNDPAGLLPEDARRYVGTAGSPLETAIGNQFKKKEKYKPGSDAELQALRKDLARESTLFRKGLGDYTGELQRGLVGQYKDSVKEGTENVNENYSRRGLLYSGLRAGKEGDLRQELGTQLAKGFYDINREGESLARSKERAASSLTLDLARANQERAESLYNSQMQNQVARRRALSDTASGVGYGLGAMYGGSNQQPAAQGMPAYGGGQMMPASNSSYGANVASNYGGGGGGLLYGKAGNPNERFNLRYADINKGKKAKV